MLRRLKRYSVHNQWNEFSNFWMNMILVIMILVLGIKQPAYYITSQSKTSLVEVNQSILAWSF